MIDVPGFGMGIVRPREIAAAFLSAEIAQPGTSAVVENPNSEIWIAHGHRADNGALQDVPVFVVGADQDVHEGPRLHKPRRIGFDGRRSRGTPRQHEPCDGCTNSRQDFRAQEGDSTQPIRRHAEWRKGLSDPPKQVVPGQDQGSRDERATDPRVFAVGPREKQAKKASCHQRRCDWF